MPSNDNYVTVTRVVLMKPFLNTSVMREISALGPVCAKLQGKALLSLSEGFFVC